MYKSVGIIALINILSLDDAIALRLTTSPDLSQSKSIPACDSYSCKKETAAPHGTPKSK